MPDLKVVCSMTCSISLRPLISLQFAAVLGMTSILWTSPAVSEEREVCAAGQDPAGVLLKVNGSVAIVDAAGRPLDARAGMALCEADRIRTGADGTVEFRLDAANMTTGTSGNATTLIPGPEAECLELESGLLWFISSVFDRFCVRTPFIDAGIDGTEAVVAVDAPTGDSLVLVREGTMTARDRREASQSVTLVADPARPLAGQDTIAGFATADTRVAYATAETVPEVFRPLLVRPDSSADWSIHYPPILIASGIDDARIAEAAGLLQQGRVEAAEGVLDAVRSDVQDGRVRAAAEALGAIAAIFRNDRETGQALADAAIAADPMLGAGHVAASYAAQARGDLDAARAAAQRASGVEPRDAYVWARRAELSLIIGDVDAAAGEVTTSLALTETALARTIEGFVALARGDRATADTSFDRALEVDAGEPLAYLGRGLSQIRAGETASGRAEIEAAIAADPRRAVLRTWLGRAYLEEGRPDKAGAQFAIALKEDPEDPNAALFEAQRLFSANRPIEALHALEDARQRGDARAPLRSREGLGEDKAVQSAALGRIYDTFGFETQEDRQAGDAVDTDPTNPEAHRLMTEATREYGRSEITRLSSDLKGRILAGPSAAIPQPQLGVANLSLLDTPGASRVTFAELAPLFEGNGVRAEGAISGGTQTTFSLEGGVAALHDDFSVNVGLFHYETDGYFVNNDVTHDVFSASANYRLAPNVTIFAEAGKRMTEGGDRRIDDTIARPRNDTLRQSEDNDQLRGGLRIDLTRDLTLIGYIEGAAQDSQLDSTVFFTDQSVTTDETGFKGEALLLGRRGPFAFQMGAETSWIDSENAINIAFPGFPPFLSEQTATLHRVHGSVDLDLPADITLTLGAAYESYEEKKSATPVSIDAIQPKFGLVIAPNQTVSLRAAYTESLTRRSIFPETLERATIAGFDQFYEDASGVEYRVLSTGLDLTPFDGWSFGVEAAQIEAVYPDRGLGGGTTDIRTFGGHVTKTFGSAFAVAIEPEVSVSTSTEAFQLSDLDSVVIPATATWFDPRGFFAQGRASYVDQTGVSDTGARIADSGVIVDAAVGYRLPAGRGVVSLDVLNVLDQDLAYFERNNQVDASNFANSLLNTHRFAPNLTVMGTIKLKL